MFKISEKKERIVLGMHTLPRQSTKTLQVKSSTKHSTQYCQNCLRGLQQYNVQQFPMIQFVSNVLSNDKTAESCLLSRGD